MPPCATDLAVLAPVRSAIELRAGGSNALATSFPQLVRSAVDFVIDPVHTARTSIAELGTFERTILSRKIEHFILDLFDAPKRVRDLVIGGTAVEVKSTTTVSWKMSRETYAKGGVCLLSRIDTARSRCSLGLIVAQIESLGSPDRYGTRSVTKLGRSKILWLLESVPFLESLVSLDSSDPSDQPLDAIRTRRDFPSCPNPQSA